MTDWAEDSTTKKQSKKKLQNRWSTHYFWCKQDQLQSSDRFGIGDFVGPRRGSHAGMYMWHDHRIRGQIWWRHRYRAVECLGILDLFDKSHISECAMAIVRVS